jgi:HK97 family phage portal protein
MGLMGRIFGKPAPRGVEARAVSLEDIYGSDALAGPVATAETAVSHLPVVARAVAVQSQTVAMLPLNVHRLDGTIDAGHPLQRLLNETVNDRLSAFSARETMIREVLLYGNSIWALVLNDAVQVVGLRHLPQGQVAIERVVLTEGDRLRFRNRAAVYSESDVLHVRGPSKDGLLGQSLIELSPGIFRDALLYSETARALLQNSVRSGTVFIYPEKLSPDAMAQRGAFIRETYASPKNAGKALLLDAAAKVERMAAFSPEELQWAETRQRIDEALARACNMTLTGAALMDRASYSNSEHEAKALVAMCLAPLAARIEADMMRCLLTEDERRTHYLRHDMSELLRGDQKARFESYRLAREIGAMSANDIRRLENLPPIGPEGDAYHMPANWMRLGENPEAAS